jgi:hypothetical protein
MPSQPQPDGSESGPPADARNCLDCGQLFEARRARRARQRRCGRCIRIRGNKRRLEAKTEALTHYGGGTTVCANPYEQHDKPYTEIRALTLDYITGGHGKTGMPRGRQLYRRLRREDWPPGWQVLCCNCQSLKVIENEELRIIYKRKFPKVKAATRRHRRPKKETEDQSGAS